MSKNDMKLIIEGWRHSLKEINAVSSGGVQTGPVTKKEELNEEELDEGIKEIAFGTILALMGIGDAAAGTISDPVAGKTYSEKVVKGAAQAAAGAAAKNPDNKALQVLAQGLQAADENPGDTTMGAVPGIENLDVAADVADYAKHVLDSTEAKFAPDDSEADAPEASGKPDISGMSAPEARKVLYDYYKSIGLPGGMTTTRVNNDLRKAGIGQPTDAEREKMIQQQADAAAKLKKAGIREGEPPKVQPDPYRFDDEEIVDAIYNSDQRKNGFFDYYRVQSLMQSIRVTPYKLVGLRNRLRGMRLDDKGEAVLSYLNDLTPNDEDDLYESAI